jgi:hypothetical protein
MALLQWCFTCLAQACAVRPCSAGSVNDVVIHVTNSSIVTDGSLSTFDSSVSCLYFFEYEYGTNVPSQYPAAGREQDGDPALVKIALYEKAPDNNKKRGFQ